MRIGKVSPEALRLWSFVVAGVLLFGMLGIRLFQLQVLQWPEYREKSDHNRFRLIEIAPPRGVMRDRRGRLLVTNRPSYTCYGVPGELWRDKTGMAFYDGKRWYHIWCSVNEGISSAATLKPNNPSTWKYLGSKVMSGSSRALAIKSSHEVVVDGAPLRIDRYAHFRAGDTYFILSIKVTNIGGEATSYCYCYGDDPWLGDFGTAAGNVGWVEGRVINYVQWVDTSKYGYAGMFDYGNSAMGKGHNFTKRANFIEWLGDNRPDLAHFSNSPVDFPQNGGVMAPLSSNARFIGLQWGPHILQPGGSESMTIAVGMAGLDPMTKLPVKPEIRLNYIP